MDLVCHKEGLICSDWHRFTEDSGLCTAVFGILMAYFQRESVFSKGIQEEKCLKYIVTKVLKWTNTMGLIPMCKNSSE